MSEKLRLRRMKLLRLPIADTSISKKEKRMLMRRRNKKNCNTTPSGWSSSSSFDIILFPTASLFFHGPSIKWALTFSRTSVVVSLPSRLRVLNLCYHLCLIKNENNGSFFLFWINFYVTCFAFPTLRYVRPSAHPSVFWAAAPKGTKSCRTQGDILASNCPFVTPRPS